MSGVAFRGLWRLLLILFLPSAITYPVLKTDIIEDVFILSAPIHDVTDL
jgi:hypothetical protein